MITLTAARVRAGRLLVPDGPHEVPRPGDEEDVRRVLVPFPWASNSHSPDGYEPRAAYFYERTRHVTDYEIQGGELVSVDRDQFTREIVSIFIPSGEGDRKSVV